MSLGNVSKVPPVGPMPLDIWEETRMADLARAIYSYIDYGRFDELVLVWVDELQVRINKRILENK